MNETFITVIGRVSNGYLAVTEPDFVAQENDYILDNTKHALRTPDQCFELYLFRALYDNTFKIKRLGYIVRVEPVSKPNLLTLEQYVTTFED